VLNKKRKVKTKPWVGPVFRQLSDPIAKEHKNHYPGPGGGGPRLASIAREGAIRGKQKVQSERKNGRLVLKHQNSRRLYKGRGERW